MVGLLRTARQAAEEVRGTLAPLLVEHDGDRQLMHAITVGHEAMS
jgi:hypothetical protein